MTGSGYDVPSEALADARAILADAERVVVLTGAGISAESGVPTFRGEGGLWRNHRPEELATPDAFARDPVLVWTWYAWRRELVGACRPNAGHRSLAGWLLDHPERRLVSQNVDGLHERAAGDVALERGVEPDGALPLDLHGSLFGDRCSDCGGRTSGRDRAVDASSVATLPRCDGCGGLLRPDVVWFGEALDPDVIGAAFAAAESADVCLVVGTSAVVHPAASVPLATLQSGGHLVEVNPESTALTRHCRVQVPGPAAAVLPVLLGGGPEQGSKVGASAT